LTQAEAQAPAPSRGRILLGITGGVAAYKTAELARLMVKRGYDVWPVMTPWASRFIGPLTLEALTGHAVRADTPAREHDLGIEHITLVRAADLFVIAPLTANTMAKMAQGLADNFLTAAYLAHRGLVLVCPAMNTAMWEHPATRRNLAQLIADGVRVIEGEPGGLACGEVGAGRMAEPAVILEWVDMLVEPDLPAVAGKRVLVSAGPTREDLDPVRFLTNRSSGKMGLAVARAFRDAGARVTLVHGPIHESTPAAVETVAVTSAAEMAAAILERQTGADIIVMTAAVADYRPQKSAQKLKKENFDGHLRLERTVDILAALGRDRKPGQVLVGFAAESENLAENARAKLLKKNLDLIFANDISGEAMGFATDRNRLQAFARDGASQDLGEGSKEDLAREIVRLIGQRLAKA